MAAPIRMEMRYTSTEVGNGLTICIVCRVVKNTVPMLRKERRHGLYAKKGG